MCIAPHYSCICIRCSRFGCTAFWLNVVGTVSPNDVVKEIEFERENQVNDGTNEWSKPTTIPTATATDNGSNSSHRQNCFGEAKSKNDKIKMKIECCEVKRAVNLWAHIVVTRHNSFSYVSCSTYSFIHALWLWHTRVTHFSDGVKCAHRDRQHPTTRTERLTLTICCIFCRCRCCY